MYHSDNYSIALIEEGVVTKDIASESVCLAANIYYSMMGSTILLCQISYRYPERIYNNLS